MSSDLKNMKTETLLAYLPSRSSLIGHLNIVTIGSVINELAKIDLTSHIQGELLLKHLKMRVFRISFKYTDTIVNKKVVHLLAILRYSTVTKSRLIDKIITISNRKPFQVALYFKPD